MSGKEGVGQTRGRNGMLVLQGVLECVVWRWELKEDGGRGRGGGVGGEGACRVALNDRCRSVDHILRQQEVTEGRLHPVCVLERGRDA